MKKRENTQQISRTCESPGTTITNLKREIIDFFTLPYHFVGKRDDKEESRRVLQAAARAYRAHENKDKPVFFDIIDKPEQPPIKVSKVELDESSKRLNTVDVMLMLNRQETRLEHKCLHNLVGPKNTISGTYRCTKCGLTLYLTVVKQRDTKRNDKHMCTVDEEKVIKMVVEEMLQQGRMFTSVDVGNRIKLSGTWISNHEVASYLRDNVITVASNLQISYIQTLIPVTLKDGSTRLATLYHHVADNPNDYKERNQKALNPIEANHPRAASLYTQAVPPAVVASAPQTPPDPDPGLDISHWRITSV